MLLSVNRISKSFEDRAVLSDVSFDIGEGEIVGYLLTAKTYSREAGGLVLWLEEMYMRPAYRSCCSSR